MSAEFALFHSLAGAAVVGALVAVANVRSTVGSVLGLLVTLLALSGIFLTQGAVFLGAVQLLLSGVVVAVLLLFAVLLVGRGAEDFAAPLPGRTLLRLAGALTVGVVAGLVAAALLGGPSTPVETSELAAVPTPVSALGLGGHRAMGLALFRDFALPLELAGLVLLSAVVGVVVIGKRRVD